METIYLEENSFPVVKMERLLDDDSEFDAKSKGENTKIGEIFQTARDRLAFVCVHCSAEFSLFIQFVAHIEKHLHELGIDLAEPAIAACRNEPKLANIDIKIKPLTTAKNCDNSVSCLIEASHTDSSILVLNESNKKINEFKCTECNESFSLQSTLMLHSSTHIKSIFACDICNWQSNKSTYFKRHMRLMHPSDQSQSKVKGANFECPECKRKFTTIIGMKSHLRRHQLYQVPKKKNSHTRQSKVQNTVVGSSVEINPNKNDNAKSIDTFECFQCHKNFKTQLQCQIHISNHLPVGTRCIRCTRPLKTKDGLQSHQKTCKPLTKKTPTECQVCNQTFPSYKHYYVHAIQDHGLVHYQVRLFQNTTCRRCGQKFQSRMEYEKHMHWHKTRPREHKCHLCDKVYSDSYRCKLHVQRHSGQGLWKCDLCDKSYDILYKKDHMRTHTGERRHQCSECGKLFFNMFRLKRHMMTHTGALPYKCEHCEKGFRQKAYLIDHVKQHADKYFYSCQICVKSFANKYIMRKHYLKFHGLNGDHR